MIPRYFHHTIDLPLCGMQLKSCKTNLLPCLQEKEQEKQQEKEKEVEVHVGREREREACREMATEDMVDGLEKTPETWNIWIIRF